MPDVGHGCGHNLLAISTLGAVIGAKAALGELPGRIVVLGTPAEEGGGGKIRMLEGGAGGGAVLPVRRERAAEWDADGRRAPTTAPVPGHSQRMAQAALSDLGHTSALACAKMLAATACELVSAPELVAKAREEFAARGAALQEASGEGMQASTLPRTPCGWKTPSAR